MFRPARLFSFLALLAALVIDARSSSSLQFSSGADLTVAAPIVLAGGGTLSLATSVVPSVASGGTLSLGTSGYNTSAGSVTKTGSGTLALVGNYPYNSGGTLIIGDSGTLVSGGVLIINPGGGINSNPGGIILNPTVPSDSYQSPAPALPAVFLTPIVTAGAEFVANSRLFDANPPVAAACTDTTAFFVTDRGGANGAPAIWAVPLVEPSVLRVSELLHSFDLAQDGFPGRALLLKDGWLYGATRGTSWTGAVVYRFNVGTRAYETLAVLPPSSTLVPVSLAFAPNGDLFVLTSAAAGPSRSLPFTLSFSQYPVATFAPTAESGALFRIPPAGSAELVHTFRPENSAAFRTASLNLPSEIACDAGGVLYGTTTARRLFTVVPGQAARWMTENPDDALPEGPFGSSFVWPAWGAGSVTYLDRKVPLHATSAGLRFHASSRGTGQTYELLGGEMHATSDAWPSELEWAAEFVPAGEGRVVALLEGGGLRRLALASAGGGLRAFRTVNGSARPIAVGVNSDRFIASDILEPTGEPFVLPGRMRLLQLPQNTPPVCTPDRFQGADVLLSGRAPGEANPPDRVYNVLQNDTDSEGDRLVITSISQPAEGSLAYLGGYPGHVMLTALPASPVFEIVASYSVTDGFGGTAEAAITFGNRAPTPKIAERPYSPTGITVNASDLAEEPDGDRLYIQAIEGTSITSLSNELAAQILVSKIGDYAVRVTDALGAETIGTLRVTAPLLVTASKTLYLAGNAGMHSIPNAGVPANLLTISIVDAPVHGTALRGAGTIQFTAGPTFAGQDSFTYVIGSPFGDLLRVTVEVRDAFASLKGTYHAPGSDGPALARLKVNARGHYTLVYRVGGRVYRRRGIVADNDQWLLPRPGQDILVSIGIVLAPEPKLQFLVGEEGGIPTAVPLLSASELSALRAPRVHAELTNVEVTPPKVRFVGGAFHVVEPGARKALPASYAILMRTSGGGVAIIGRLWDGRPWATASVVSADDQIAIGADRFSGTLSARRNGNVVGTLTTTFGTPRIVTTVGGSPFRAPAAGRNVFGGQQTAVSLRSQFPADITVTAAVNSDGRIHAALPHGISHSLQLRPADGVLAGKISVPWASQSKSVAGLYIPHKKRVVGFVGDAPAKSISIRRK